VPIAAPAVPARDAMGDNERWHAGEPGRSPSPTATVDAPGGAPDTGMPAYRTSLVGRDADRDALRHLLVDRGQRLIVITGPGGVGKTRLAVQAATDLAGYFRHGTRFLPLAPVAAGADLDATFARLLGLQDIQHRSYRDAIADHLETRAMLLVVDNAEHVPEVGGLLTFIHARCSAVAMLVTSRRTLDIYGEVVHEALPLVHRPTGGARHGDAAELLRERVRAVAPDFEITAANATDIGAICDLLGGLPLAIELTAPRLAQQAPATLRAEIGGLGAPSRAEAAMQATVRLSYDRLAPREQRVFRALGIMCGRWMIDDVLKILPPDIAEADAIDDLDELVRRSMLTSDASGAEVRFGVNPVLRHFGRRLLAELGEDRAAADRHAERLVALVEEAEPELTGPDQPWWLARLASLHDDLRAAHAHLLAHDRRVDALRLAAALWRYAYTRGHYREVRAMIEVALAGIDDRDALRARAHNGIGLLSIMLRDHDRASGAHQRALALATPLGLDREIAIARIGLADIAATVGNDTGSALEHLRHAAEAYERLDDARGIASVLTNRGYIEWQLGQLDAAFATHEEAGMLYQRTRDTRGIAWSSTNTGRIAAQQGRYHEAVRRLLGGVESYAKVGDAAGIAEILEALAAVAIGTGDLAHASTLLGAAAATRAGIGSTLSGIDLEHRDATLAAARRGASHEVAWERGARLDLDGAIALARAFPRPASPRAPEPADLRRLARERFGITTREHEVLGLLREGITDQELADRLGLSVRTVHTHTASLMRKLDVNSRIAAVRAAHRAGILPGS
jgi:non-specific serine/threonine protein kinase